MFNGRRAAILALGCILALSACGGRKSGSEAGSESAGSEAGTGKVLNLYIWSDYLAPNTLADFEKQTGIKVHVAYYDANETLETKLLAGSSGFDIVVPSASYFERQIKAGVYLKLDKSKLPNLKNLIRSSCRGSRVTIRTMPTASSTCGVPTASATTLKW